MRKQIISLFGLFAGMQGLYAQDPVAVQMASQEQVNSVLTLAILTVVMLLLIVVILAISIQTLIRITLAPDTEAAKAAKADQPSWWDRFAGLAAQPGSKMDREIGHEYDGIQELDNDMPPWFKYLFYFTILFAVAYLLNYHYFRFSPLQDDEYAQEVEQAEAELAAYREKNAMSIDENSVVFVSDAAALESGKNIYLQNCAACHGQKGEGSVGPNFTDAYWIHGGGIQNVFKTVKYGVPEKGMISWQNQLNPKQMQEVSSFILSLVGTNPPNPKEPQGEIWEDSNELPEDQSNDSADTTNINQ